MKITAKIISFGLLRALAVLGLIALFLWFIFKIKVLILYIGIAAVISLIGRPLVLFLRKRCRMGNTLAAFSTLLLVIGLVSLLLYIFVPIIVEQSRNISEIDFDLVKRDLNELNIQASDYLGVEKINIVEAIKNTSAVEDFDVEIIPSFIDIFFKNAADFIIGLFATLFLAFFFLKDDQLIPNTVTVFAKKGREKRFIVVLNKVKELLSRYFIGLTFQILILSLFYTLILLIFEIENPLAIALICAFLNIVPYLGPLIGWVLILLVVVSNNLGADFSSELLPTLGYVSLGYAIAQIFDNIISQPVIFGKSVRSHPLEIFIVILIGGYLFGIPGMILAVPTYTTLKVIAKEFLSEYKIVQRLTKNL
ncbi:MAG TPA: AI-2E family transporter [Flavobacteriaceae bacterium]|jgi:predicted PurR-regulated permease PerM|nr:AI-2E family transporter [Flavobacteriaceae bacterium]MAY53525.1 AI-2E family transporter [Flavobacteriaceae bacterium]HBR54528.1 AI-2E family transporter [Flavobacteriaceae bacterium]|tara:strand:- start:870 stop:1964 length:1095 start_codon:yes stop_codon:yes gene_type:complete